MEIFYTDVVALASDVVGVADAGAARNRARTFGSCFVPDGMPFVLQPDGSYDVVLNRFLRSLPMMGVRSQRSWRSYAYDLVVWARFLDEQRDQTMLAADADDLRAFYSARRLSQPPFQVSAATWNRLVASLEKFYGWAQAERLVSGTPLEHVAGGGSSSRAAGRAKEKAARSGDVKFLSLPRYTAFRDVGLRGRAPSGGPDPGFESRCGERNAVFADVCVTTGLRLEEVNSLLVCELPSVDVSDGARSARFDLAPLTAKGDRGRVVWFPHRVLRQVREYVEAERETAVQRAAVRGWDQRCWVPVREVDRRGGRLWQDGAWALVRWADMGPRLRSRLMLVDGAGTWIGPLALWVGERGTPMTARSWEAVFERASHRCRSLGLDADASPHTLRHTFAVHMLTQLVRRQLAMMNTGSADLRYNAYRRVMGDPLAHLQRLLGHARISTTYVYLDVIGDAQELIDEAVGELADGLSGTDRDDVLGSWAETLR